MATVKIILRNKPNKEGLMPLIIRVTKDRKSSEIHTGYKLKPTDWDEKTSRVKKSHPNSVRLNNFLIQKLSEVTNTALDLETKKVTATAASVKLKVKPKGGSSLFQQADIYIDRLQKTNHNRYSADKPRVNHIKAYFSSDIAFQDITVDKVKALKIFLKSEYGMSERTALNHLSVLRSIFRQAIDAGICEEKDRPFGKGKITIKYPDTSKAGLSQSDIEKIENIELTGRSNDARNIFLFSYYTAGTRVSDVLRMKWSDVKNGRLHYIMGKNGKGDSIKLPEKARTIIDQYKENAPKHNLIFPELKGIASLDNYSEVQKRIKTRIRGIDKLLKRIAEQLAMTTTVTMHISRHSFAQEAADKVPIGILQKLYRHSHVSTTAGYQSNFTKKDTDDALNKILGQK